MIPWPNTLYGLIIGFQLFDEWTADQSAINGDKLNRCWSEVNDIPIKIMSTSGFVNKPQRVHFILLSTHMHSIRDKSMKRP